MLQKTFIIVSFQISLMPIPLEEIEEVIKKTIGDDTIPVVRVLYGKENVSEFKLAEKLNISINNVRNLLYRLDEHNLVISTRKKDKQKGWYVYFWTLDDNRVTEFMLGSKNKRLKELREKFEKERDICFFYCPNKCLRTTFENAMESQFKCIECNSILVQEDTQKRCEAILNEMSKLEREIKQIEEQRVKPEEVEEPVKKKQKGKNKHEVKRETKAKNEIKKILKPAGAKNKKTFKKTNLLKKSLVKRKSMLKRLLRR